MSNGARRLAAELADDLRPMVQVELMKSWRDGVEAGIALAKHAAETVRDEMATRPELRAAVEAFDGYIASLADKTARPLTQGSTVTKSTLEEDPGAVGVSDSLCTNPADPRLDIVAGGEVNGPTTLGHLG